MLHNDAEHSACSFLANTFSCPDIFDWQGPSVSLSQNAKKTIGHRGIDPTGETTYKKVPLYDQGDAFRWFSVT